MMVNQETISDVGGIFENSGAPTAALLRKLTVRGRTDKVGKSLEKNFKWDSKEPIVTVVNSVDSTSGKIPDTGYIALGTKTISFMATDLWVNSPKEARVEIVIEDLGEFVFPRGQHFSEWTDSDTFITKIFKNKEKQEMDPQEQENAGIGAILLRLCLTPTCVGVVTAMNGALPIPLETATAD